MVDLQSNVETKQGEDWKTAAGEKCRLIHKGNAVIADDKTMEFFEWWSVRSNLNLEVVSIPNPNRVGIQDAYLAGFISAPEIEAYRISQGLEEKEQVEIIHEIATISGLTLTKIYSWREGLSQDGRISKLKNELQHWKWKAEIVKMPSDMKMLDLSTKDGLVRAIQIQQAEDRRRESIKYCHKYYSNYSDVLALELAKVEAGYKEDLLNPLCVGNETIADAILNRNAPTLIYYFTKGLFKSCEKVFGKATGVRISRLSKANKEEMLLQWAN